jgi:capsular polysaccharide biosynthesis protein
VDFGKSLKVMLRRWYVTVPVLLLTAAAAFLTVQTVRPSYQATANVLLLAPAHGDAAPAPGQDAPPAINPYLHFDKSLKVAADMLATVLNSPRMVEHLAAAGATSSYDVTLPPQQSSWQDDSPIMRISADDADRDAAEHTVAIIVQQLSYELARRQKAADAPRSTLIQAQVTTPPTVTGKLMGSTMRALGAVGILGVALALGMASMAEAAAATRSRRRSLHRRPAVVASPPASPAPEAGIEVLDLEPTHSEPSPQRDLTHAG